MSQEKDLEHVGETMAVAVVVLRALVETLNLIVMKEIKTRRATVRNDNCNAHWCIKICPSILW